MARIVVVATSPVDREALADHVGAEDELVVVAPAVEQSRLDWLTNDEGEARGHAQAVGEIVAEEAPADAETVEVKPDPQSGGSGRDRRTRSRPHPRRRAQGRGRDLARGRRPHPRTPRGRPGDDRQGLSTRRLTFSRIAN